MRQIRLISILFVLVATATGCGPDCSDQPTSLEEAACQAGFDTPTTAPEYADDSSVDWSQAEQMAAAALQAYDTLPTECSSLPTSTVDGYTLVDCWTGWSIDRYEGFGYIYRRDSAVPGESGPRYLFAFRGTQGIRDDIGDLWSLAKTPWHYGGEVGQGFFWNYAATMRSPKPTTLPAIDCNAADQSMRTQLFCRINRYRADPTHPLRGIEITGHSLGSALGTLFASDLANQPGYSDLIKFNWNFASPRVGDSGFQSGYNGAASLTDTRLFASQWDLVPCVPMEDLGYRHVGQTIPLNFHETDENIARELLEFAWCVHEHGVEHCLGIHGIGELILTDHSSINYHAVVYCTEHAPGNVCHQTDWNNPIGPEKTYGTINVDAPGSFDVCSYF